MGITFKIPILYDTLLSSIFIGQARTALSHAHSHNYKNTLIPFAFQIFILLLS